MARIGVGLALIVALCWGSADIVATVAARHQGTFVTTLLSLIVSSTVLMAFGLFTLPQLQVENGFSPAPSELGLALLAGMLTAVVYFSLYRGLELGPLAIVSPITASDGVVGALLAVAFLHNSLSFWQAGMMLAVFVGLICASFDSEGPEHRFPRCFRMRF
jgi:drug/metabolite transporter (DMT)-like permease